MPLKIKTRCSVTPFVFAGTYWTSLDPYLWIYDDRIKDHDIRVDDYRDNFNFTKFKEFLQWVLEHYIEYQVNPYLEKYNSKILLPTLWVRSPSYYNYSNDELYFDIELDQLKIEEEFKKLYKEKANEIDTHLDNWYSSYDWFISLIPNNKDWLLAPEHLDSALLILYMFDKYNQIYDSKMDRINNIIDEELMTSEDYWMDILDFYNEPDWNEQQKTEGN